MASGDWVELRVHGVSGTPPEDLLDRPHVVQVDGDGRSRFFRVTDGQGRIVPGTADGHTIEAFHWGRWTSGSWRNALWLLVLPFGLVNLAAFMLPAPKAHTDRDATTVGSRCARWAALAALRATGLVLTMVAALGLTQTLVDVVGARWLGRREGVPGWVVDLGPLLGLVGVVALIVGALGGRRLLRRPPPGTGDAGDADDTRDPTERFATPFASARFFDRDPTASHLRIVHVTVALAVPAWVVLARDAGDARAMPVAAIALAAFLVGVLGGDIDDAATVGYGERPGRRPGLRRVAVLLLALALAAVAVAACAAAGNGPKAAAYESAAITLMVAGAVAGAALAGAVGWLASQTMSKLPPGDTPPPWWWFRPYARRWGAAVVGAIGLVLGVGYAAGLVLTTARLLRVPDVTTGESAAHLQRVAYGFALGVVPIVVIVVALTLQSLRSRSRVRARADATLRLPRDTDPALLAPARDRIARAIWIARVKNGVGPIAVGLAGSAALLTLAILLEECGLSVGPLSADATAATPTERFLVGAGPWLLVALGLGFVALARGALRDTDARRALNVVWDVVAFWPHAAHPFVPQPYSQRVVDDLVGRIRHHLGRTSVLDARPVVVSAHSQGSLIAFAALHRLTDAELARVGLVTYGSQLRVIFPRAFPAYVDLGAITVLRHRLGAAWVNLYRDTDPLAGPVHSWRHDGTRAAHMDSGNLAVEGVGLGAHGTLTWGDDWRLADPVPHLRALDPAPVDLLDKHSHYWRHPDYPAALDAVRARRRPAP